MSGPGPAQRHSVNMGQEKECEEQRRPEERFRCVSTYLQAGRPGERSEHTHTRAVVRELHEVLRASAHCCDNRQLNMNQDEASGDKGLLVGGSESCIENTPTVSFQSSITAIITRMTPPYFAR